MDHQPGLFELVWKAAVVHTATYFAVGATAYYLFDYSSAFASGDLATVMIETSDPLVIAGPLFQPIRGALFGLVFYLLRDAIFTRSTGWLVMWALLAIVGIINTFGPTPGSIEGAIYTRFSWPAMVHPSMIEVYSQALLLAAGTFFWVRFRENWWIGGVFIVLATLAVLGSLAGLFLAPLSA